MSDYQKPAFPSFRGASIIGFLRRPILKDLRTPACLAIFLTVAVLLVAAPTRGASTDTAFDHRHTLFDGVLQKYVKNGRVNYRKLKADQKPLDRYLQTLADVEPATYDSWTRQQKLAFWINAYNAYTIKVILQNYPIERSILADPLREYPADGIRQIPGVWKKLEWPVAGKKYTLDYMEHVIMRQELAEPRIHYALVCASIGCPLLESRAFDADHLEQRLEQAALNYIYRDNKVQIDKKKKVVRLPQIYKWFAEDFKPFEESADYFRKFPPNVAGPLNWVYRYANKEDRDFLRQGSFEVTYLFYDWGLNDMD